MLYALYFCIAGSNCVPVVKFSTKKVCELVRTELLAQGSIKPNERLVCGTYTKRE